MNGNYKIWNDIRYKTTAVCVLVRVRPITLTLLDLRV